MTFACATSFVLALATMFAYATSFNVALASFRELAALAQDRGEGDRQAEADALFNGSIQFWRQGNYQEALEVLQEASVIYFAVPQSLQSILIPKFAPYQNRKVRLIKMVDSEARSKDRLLAVSLCHSQHR
ncbi:MAG: tetratricopeptide repeat protein [Elainellaceae cyanobacterium]